MPFIIESNEWRLLHGLALLLDYRKAPFQVRPKQLIHPNMNHNAELFEIELRRTFMLKACPQNLDKENFSQCQVHLSILCSLLDGLATNIDHCTLDDVAYPRLRVLTRFLESTLETVDLAIGPHKTLFRMPGNNSELSRCLKIVTDCNNTLSRLLELPQQRQFNLALPNQQYKRTWKNARVRNRVNLTLGSLREYFRCGASHEVLLRLFEDNDETSVLPNLQLMLPLCAQPEFWYEARCTSVDLYDFSSNTHYRFLRFLIMSFTVVRLRCHPSLIFAQTSGSTLAGGKC